MTDEIVREIRRVRHDISRRCGHAPRKVVAFYREFQEEMKRSGKYHFRGKAAETGDAKPGPSDVDASVGM